ncbi:3D domain-containing protein [Enterococcus olivae]
MNKRFLPVAMLAIVAVFSSIFPVYAAEEQEETTMSYEVFEDDTVKDMSGLLISLAVESDAVKEVQAEIEAKEKAEREAKEKAEREAKEAKERAEREAARRTMVMESTAYSSDPADKLGGGTMTATGQNLLQNPMAVAVDPNVIPLGTRLHVEGYGEAIASDTGGAIKGNIVDVHFPTYAQCVQWGRRQVTVTILD